MTPLIIATLPAQQHVGFRTGGSSVAVLVPLGVAPAPATGMAWIVRIEQSWRGRLVMLASGPLAVGAGANWRAASSSTCGHPGHSRHLRAILAVL